MIQLFQVTENIFIRPALSDKVTPDDLERLGIQRMYSLYKRGQPSLVDWPGYVHMPMVDGKNIPPEAHVAAAMVANDVRDDLGVIVACHRGRNRSALVIGMALQRLGLQGPEAVRLILEARPAAFLNQHFKKYLMEGTENR